MTPREPKPKDPITDRFVSELPDDWVLVKKGDRPSLLELLFQQGWTEADLAILVPSNSPEEPKKPDEGNLPLG